MKLFIALLLSCGTALAATYPVGPGQTYTTFGALFSAVDLSPGDIVEARAATVGGSYTFTETVSPGANDFGASGNPLIIRARSGDTITIDAQNTRNYCLEITSSANSYITVQGFAMTGANIYLCRVQGASAGSLLDGFTFQNNALTIANNAATSFSHEGFLCQWMSNLIIRSNTITTVAASMPYQTDGMYIQNSSSVLIEYNRVEIRNNDGTGHNDCIQFAAIDAGVIPDFTIRNNTLIQNSTATGHTQVLYCEYPKAGTVRIYNNVFIVANANTGSFAVTVTPKATSTVQVYVENNSFWLNGNNSGLRMDPDVSNPYIRNNVFQNDNASYSPTAFWLESLVVTTSRINNNIWFYSNPANSSNMFRDAASFKTWAQWQATGKDVNSFNSNPIYVNRLNFNLQLSAGSPGIGTAQNLAASFTTDITGATRTSPWDMGAYKYGAGPVQPPVPTNLRFN